MKVDKLKNELWYLWSAYRWPLLAGVLAVSLALFFVVKAFTKKEPVLSVMLIDCHTDVTPEQMEKDFLTSAGYDGREQTAEFVTNLLFEDAAGGNYAMTSLSRFLTDIGSNKLDVCGMQEESFLKYDESETWLDLSELLDTDTLSKLAGSLVTRDGRVIGIYTDALPVLREYGCYENTSSGGVLGVVYNTPHREAAETYLLYAAGLQE